MSKPETWQQLISTTSIEPVNSVRLLRPNDEQAFQYLCDGQEFLSINSRQPYGALSERAFDDPEGLYLLPASRSARDFTEFSVSKELLSLRALSLGTGRKEASQLSPVYRQVGGMIKQVVELTDGALPELTLDDVAYDRQSHKPVLIPPVNFGASRRGTVDYVTAFTRSMEAHFARFWRLDDAIELMNEVTEGMSHDLARQRH